MLLPLKSGPTTAGRASQLQKYSSISGDERLTEWLRPTVNVPYAAFSAAVSGGVGLVSPVS